MQWVATIQLFHEDFEQTSKRRVGFGLGRLNVGILRPRPPTYPTTANSEGFPERNFSDLFPRWLGTRELLLHGRDPYSPEITKEIQQGYYGRPIDSSRATDPIDEQRFAYPLFVVFLLAPTITVPFIVVKAVFTAILFAAAVWSVLLWIRVIGLTPGPDKTFTYMMLTLATIPYVQGIQFQQLSV